MAKNNWTREQLIVAFNLYCKTPFSKINASNKAVKELAPVIGRSHGALAMKLANFARLDPALQAQGIKGLKGGSKGEEIIWEEFSGNWEELAWQSELILAEFKNNPIESSSEISLDDLPKEGIEREAMIKVRVNQSFFRKTILASYNNKCCITGISEPGLLVASHIIPWSANEKARMNPANGLCLNALHDKAFDKGLLTIGEDYRVILAKELLEDRNEKQRAYFYPYNGTRITLPQKFYPAKEFLYYHNKFVFKDSI